jgi:phosphoribosylaminoimidazole-succinocarboxamide synthase
MGAWAVEKREQLYEGKAKRVYATDDPALVIVSYKDDATAGNGAKKGTIAGKGAINNQVTNHLMRLLEGQGVPTHYVRQLNACETLVKKVEIVPLEVIVRNLAAGSLAERLGLEEGTRLGQTVLEFCYKNDALGDPMVNDTHILAMGWASAGELKALAGLSFKINALLTACLGEAHVELVDFKLEFGRLPGGQIVLADEISPDTCRFWDVQTKRSLDKDRFRRDLGDVVEAYREVMRRLMGQ